MTRTTVQPPPAVAGARAEDASPSGLLVYLLLGTIFGVILVKSEVISWFRIQEMFRFQSFHMYGVIASAVLVAALSVQLIRRSGITTRAGEPIVIPPKRWGRYGTRYWAGGTIFGVGWALTGACPGPLFALLGAGVAAIAVAIVSALAGAWVYGYLRPRLPH
jgi:uncharacterized membrane protein YedE/YeeE